MGTNTKVGPNQEPAKRFDYVALVNPATGAYVAGGGGGGGGEVTAAEGAFADGSIVVLGSLDDPAWDGNTANPTAIAVWKGIYGEQAAADLKVGDLTDPAWDGTGDPDSLIAIWKNLASGDPIAVVGTSVVVSATPTVSTTAYAAGDVIGTKMTFAGMARANGLTGLVQTAMIQCKSAQTFACDLIVFHTDPTNTTFTDNAALAVNAADFDKVALRIPFVAGDWSALGTPSVAEVSAQGKLYKCASGTMTLFGVLVARGTPTLASTSDLKVILKGMLD